MSFVEAESWQLDEIHGGITELDENRGVAHEDVAAWLGSWGRKREHRVRGNRLEVIAVFHERQKRPKRL